MDPRGARSSPTRALTHVPSPYLGMVKVEQQGKAPMHPREQKVHGFEARLAGARAPLSGSGCGAGPLSSAPRRAPLPPGAEARARSCARGWSTVCAHSRLTRP